MYSSVKILTLFKVLFLFNNKIDADNNILLPQDVNNDVKNIGGCIKDIIEVFSFKTAIFVWNDSLDNTTNTFFDLDEIFEELKVPLVIFEEIEMKDYELLANKYSVFVLYYMEDCEAVLDYNWTSLYRGIKHLIITPDYCMDDVATIGKDVDTYLVTFLLLNKLNLHELITFIPKDKCDVNGKSEPIHINTCSNGSIHKQRNKIFPLKNAKNLEGCTLVVGISLLSPFTMADDAENKKSLDELNEVHGSDIDLLNIIAERVNASFIYRNIMGGTKACAELLSNGSVDLCGGGLTVYGNGDDHLGFTDSYTSQNFVWMYAVNRSPKIWLRIISRISTMYPFFLFYLTYCILFYISNYVHGVSFSLSDSFLYGWGAYFGAILLPHNNNFTQQILNLCFMISSLYIILFTSSEVYSYFTLELAPKVYRTDHELLSSGLKVFLNPSWNYSLSSRYTKEELQYLSIYDCYSFDDCEMKTLKHNGMTITAIGKYILFQDETAENYEARVLKLKNNVFTRPVVIVMRKDLSIIHIVRDLTRRVLESGMYSKFYTDGIGTNLIARTKVFADNIRKEDYSCKVGCRVAMDKIMPVFYMWMLGCYVAFIVFLTEIYK